MSTNPSMRLALHGPGIGDPDIIISVELTDTTLDENDEIISTFEWTGSQGSGITGGRFRSEDFECGLGWAMDVIVQSLLDFHFDNDNPMGDPEIGVATVVQYGARNALS